MSIAAQVVSCCQRRNHLHNLVPRATIRPLETRNDFCPVPVKACREMGRKRFMLMNYLKYSFSTILEYKFILLWKKSTAGFDLTVCDHISNRKLNYSLTSAYIFISTILPHFTALLFNVPSYWNPAFSNALHEAIL